MSHSFGRFVNFYSSITHRLRRFVGIRWGVTICLFSVARALSSRLRRFHLLHWECLLTHCGFNKFFM